MYRVVLLQLICITSSSNWLHFKVNEILWCNMAIPPFLCICLRCGALNSLLIFLSLHNEWHKSRGIDQGRMVPHGLIIMLLIQPFFPDQERKNLWGRANRALLMGELLALVTMTIHGIMKGCLNPLFPHCSLDFHLKNNMRLKSNWPWRGIHSTLDYFIANSFHLVLEWVKLSDLRVDVRYFWVTLHE